jgi:signal transduction histidine kinase
LAQQLLTFGRVSRPCPRQLDLGEALIRGRCLWQKLLPEAIRIELDPAEGLPCVWADPAAIDQLVLNLVINARDAMPQGGSISIATRAVTLSAPLLGKGLDLPPGRWVQLSVCDTGGGIPQPLRKRIFEPFFTTKPAGCGSGLGLTMVHAIVIESGGQIAVSDWEGIGSRFDVYLPAMQEDELEQSP